MNELGCVAGLLLAVCTNIYILLLIIILVLAVVLSIVAVVVLAQY
jgi:hypothetical protein